ncbi:hypothetical protein O9992_03840 [Vibrio lentus]|nr:hypothetical protein [Vibrio lentus]
MQGSVYIGTDHGFYSFIDKESSFNRSSGRFGKVVDIEQEAKDSSPWFAGSYGVYRIPYDSNASLMRSPLSRNQYQPELFDQR